MAFTPTPEQSDIYDAVKGDGNVTVKAVAGSGKTTTLIGIANLFPRTAMLYLAYNRMIKDEAMERFPRNVVVKTSHGFAWTREAGDQMKATSYVLPANVCRILGINSGIALHSDLAPMKAERVARIALETVNRFCNSAALTPQLAHVPTEAALGDGIAAARLAEYVLPFAVKAWAHMSTGGTQLNFDHDHYLKARQLHFRANRHKVPKYGIVLFDEAQDSNPVVLDMVDMLAANGARVVAVGDEAQAIYGFRGAINAMAHYPGAVMPLTKSFRFGDAIANEANLWLDELALSDVRVVGHSPINSTIVKDLEDPHAILCRSNGGAIAEIMALRERGVARVAIAGGPKPIKDMAMAAVHLLDGKGTDHPELSAFTTWEELRTHVEEDATLSSLRRYVKLVDRYGAWTLVYACNDLVDERKGRPQVIVATGHKCKGMEFETVRVSSDFSPPKEDEDGNVADIAREEAQLAYVTVTRAKRVLDRGSLEYIDAFRSV